MGNPNCYSYALSGVVKLKPTGQGQARPGSSAKVLGQHLDDRVIDESRVNKLLHGIWADLRCFGVADGDITPTQWNDDTVVPDPLPAGHRIIAMIYHDQGLGWHFYRKDGAIWKFISGANNAEQTITEANLLNRTWGAFNDAHYQRGYFISFPNKIYGPLLTRPQEWWVG
jgi:hypothetical protein